MTATAWPATSATISVGQRLTRVECAPVVRQLTSRLRAAGIAAGDRVLLFGSNDPGYLMTMLALIGLDVSLVLADTGQTAAETVAVAARARVRWALLGAGAGCAETRQAVADRIGADRVFDYADLVAEASRAATTSVPADADRCDALGTAPDALAESAFGAWRNRRDAAVLWSSGTTGVPKGVVRSGASLITNTVATLRAMGYRRDDVLFPLLPFSHQYGMSLVLIWWLTGCSLLVAPYRRLADALTAIAQHGVTAVDAAPTTYHALLGFLDRGTVDRSTLASVRMWCVGGAPLPTALADRFAGALGAPLLDGYGLSEVGNVALTTVENPVGCGRPLPGVEVRVVELPGRAGPLPGPRSGTERDPVPPDTPVVRHGEIQVRSPGLMEGYLDEAGELRPVPRGWFGSGDLGYLDAAGNVHVIGRHQAVHRMGYTLYPESIQRQIEACGAPVCLVSVDDERRGCQLVLFVEDPQQRDVRYWRDRIDTLLAAYERPNAIEVLPRLPLGSTGKTDKAHLARLAAGRWAAPRDRENT